MMVEIESKVEKHLEKLKKVKSKSELSGWINYVLILKTKEEVRFFLDKLRKYGINYDILPN